MDELTILAETLHEHRYELFGICVCGRNPARSFFEHQAEEVELALRNAGYGIFAFERLGLLDEL